MAGVAKTGVPSSAAMKRWASLEEKLLGSSAVLEQGVPLRKTKV